MFAFDHEPSSTFYSMRSRLIACLVCALVLGGCDRIRETKLTGNWRCETADGVEEFSFQPDHSFRCSNTYKKVVVQPSVVEETGTWRVSGNKLVLDSITTWSKQRTKISRKLGRLAKDTVVIKSADGMTDLSYDRTSR